MSHNVNTPLNTFLQISAPNPLFSKKAASGASSIIYYLIGRALHRYHRGQGFKSRTSLNFFQAFLFATAKVAYITAMIILHLILHSAVHIHGFHYIQNFTIIPSAKKIFNSNFKLSPYTRILFLPLVKEQLSKLILFNVGKGVINNCQKLLLKGEITVIETQKWYVTRPQNIVSCKSSKVCFI